MFLCGLLRAQCAFRSYGYTVFFSFLLDHAVFAPFWARPWYLSLGFWFIQLHRSLFFALATRALSLCAVFLFLLSPRLAVFPGLLCIVVRPADFLLFFSLCVDPLGFFFLIGDLPLVMWPL